MNDSLQAQKAALLSGISAWPEASLRFRPAPQAWSALNVLDHLVKVERTWLAAIRASLPDGHPISLKDRLRRPVVFWVMRSPLRVKVPASAAGIIPDNSGDLAAITAGWDTTRAEMAELLAGLLPPQLRCGLFKHSVSGWMTIAHSLQFLSAHVQHHTHQLRRLELASRARPR